jgi:hypothetical protein
VLEAVVVGLRSDEASRRRDRRATRGDIPPRPQVLGAPPWSPSAAPTPSSPTSPSRLSSTTAGSARERWSARARTNSVCSTDSSTTTPSPGSHSPSWPVPPPASASRPRRCSPPCATPPARQAGRRLGPDDRWRPSGPRPGHRGPGRRHQVAGIDKRTRGRRLDQQMAAMPREDSVRGNLAGIAIPNG